MSSTEGTYQELTVLKES